MKQIQLITLYNNELDIYDRSKLAVAGLNHTYLINNNSYTRLTLAASTLINKDVVDSLSAETGDPVDFIGRISRTAN